VLGQAVADAAEESELVGAAGQPGQMLAELDAGDAGGDCAKFAAVFDRRLGLGIKTVDVAGTAGQVDEDRRGRFGIGFYFAGFGEAKKIGQGDAGGAEDAGAEGVAAMDAIAVLVSCHERLGGESGRSRRDHGIHEKHERREEVATDETQIYTDEGRQRNGGRFGRDAEAGETTKNRKKEGRSHG